MSLPLGDLGSQILAVFGSTVTLERRAAGAFVNGTWVAGSLTTSSISAAVQPAGVRDLLKLPEGERTEETIAIFTIAPLIVSEVAGAQEGDRIIYQGRTYRVRAIDDWSPHANYVRAIATRVSP